MSKRSGQSGYVLLRNDRWIGRFYVDVPGQTNRTRKAVVLGMKNELTKPQAKMKLKTICGSRRQHSRTFRAVAKACYDIQRSSRFVGVETATAVEGKQPLLGAETYH